MTKSIMNVEFTAKTGKHEFKEESITFHNPAELFQFASPGGGCERIADDVSEIQMVLLPHPDNIVQSQLDEIPVTLEFGIIFLTGSFSDVVQTSQQLLGKANRGELSQEFMKVAGLSI